MWGNGDPYITLENYLKYLEFVRSLQESHTQKWQVGFRIWRLKTPRVIFSFHLSRKYQKNVHKMQYWESIMYLSKNGHRAICVIVSNSWDVKILATDRAVLLPVGLFLKIKLKSYKNVLLQPDNISDMSVLYVMHQQQTYSWKFLQKLFWFCFSLLPIIVVNTLVIKEWGFTSSLVMDVVKLDFNIIYIFYCVVPLLTIWWQLFPLFKLGVALIKII